MTTRYRLLALLFPIVCLVYAGCSSTTTPLLSPAANHAGISPAEFTVKSAEGLAIPVEWVCDVEQLPGQTALHISPAVETEATAFLIDITYNPDLVDPRVAEFNPSIGGDSSLTLELLNTPGRGSFGLAETGGELLRARGGENVLTVLFDNGPAAGTRAGSVVPANANSLCPLSWEPDSSTLSWLYTNPGDYDQNGEVGISDILPLAVNFGATGPFPVDSALMQVDGTKDGEISLADLSTIGIYYGNRIDGYRVFGSEDFSNVPIGFADPSLIDPLATLQMAEAAGDPLVDRLAFSHQLESVLADGFYWVRPYVAFLGGGIEEGTRSNFNGGRLSTGVPGGFNLVPVASLSLEFNGDTVPTVVDFDAGESTDADGWIAFFEWDFEGDGLYDSLGDSPEISHTYSLPGTYAPLVRVTDNEGSWDIFQSPEFELVQQQDPEPTNVKPLADILATVYSGDIPLSVGLIASGSHDVDGLIINYRWDLDGDSNYETNSGTDPTIVREFTTPGTITVGVRVTDDDGAQDTDTLTLELTDPNLPSQRPVVILRATPTSGPAPLQIHLDASDSFDPDGELVRFDYDFDNDGFWDAYDGGEEVDFTIFEPGPVSVKVRGTDNDGEQNTAATGILVTHPGIIPPNANLVATVPADPAPVIVDVDASGTTQGRHPIARYDFDLDDDGIFELFDAPNHFSWEFNEAGEYNLSVRVTDTEGTSAIASTVATVFGPEHRLLGRLGNSTGYMSMNRFLERPAILYYDPVDKNLVYMLADDDDGTGGWDSVVIDETGDVGMYCTLFNIMNFPAVAYYDATNTALKYARATSLSGLDGWNIYTVDDSASVGKYCKLNWIDNGSFKAPSIAYYDESSGALRYANAADNLGDGAWISTQINPPLAIWPETVSLVPVLFGVEERPAVCVISGTDELLYLTANSRGGHTTWTTTSLAASVLFSQATSMAIVNGNPAVAYINGGVLKYLRADTANGLAGWTPNTIDDIGNPDRFCALRVVNGVPVAAYLDSSGTVSLATALQFDGLGDWHLMQISSDGTSSGNVDLFGIASSVGVCYNNIAKRQVEYAYIH